jgi:hypothetical protein
MVDPWKSPVGIFCVGMVSMEGGTLEYIGAALMTCGGGVKDGLCSMITGGCCGGVYDGLCCSIMTDGPTACGGGVYEGRLTSYLASGICLGGLKAAGSIE